MTAPPDPWTVIPPPLDDDDDDVAWAVQTAQVEWKRGATGDAVVWLRRAAEFAITVGKPHRAAQLTSLIADLEERIVESVFTGSAPPPGTTGADVDALLSGVPSAPFGAPSVRQSIDIEFEEVELVDPTDVMAGGGHPRGPLESVESVPGVPPAVTQRAAAGSTSPAEPSPRRVHRPPPPSSVPQAPESSGPTPFTDEDEDVETGLHQSGFEGTLTDVYRAQAAEAEPTIVPEQARTVTPEELAAAGGYSHDEDEEETTLGTRPQLPPSSMPAAPAPAPLATEVDALRAGSPLPASAEVEGVDLANVAGLQDLPVEAQLELTQSAQIERLDVDEEVSAFAVALVVGGWVSIMPAIADAACAFGQPGDVVFTRGTLEDSVALRVVAGETDTLVAVWDAKALEAATASCPWVADELRLVADRFQALAGAAMGPLGDRLDDTLRQSVTDRCTVKTLMSGEEIVSQGGPVPGMHIVGGGSVELVGPDGQVTAEIGPGEFLFATEVMSASPAPCTARAGVGGALILFADRHTAHELMVSVPPLLEILAS